MVTDTSFEREGLKTCLDGTYEHPLIDKQREFVLGSDILVANALKVLLDGLEQEDNPTDDDLQESDLILRTGDEVSREFILANLRLVISIAKRHAQLKKYKSAVHSFLK